jgi:hypothetical protein
LGLLVRFVMLLLGGLGMRLGGIDGTEGGIDWLTPFIGPSDDDLSF